MNVLYRTVDELDELMNILYRTVDELDELMNMLYRTVDELDEPSYFFDEDSLTQTPILRSDVLSVCQKSL